MQLNYKILWFEDQADEVEAARRRVERHIKKLGFVPEILQEVNGDGVDHLARDHAHMRDIDLVVVDYDLGGGKETGDIIAQKISNNFPVEIIFYSGAAPAELRQKVCDKKIDGVFIGHRDELANDINKIIDYSLRKFTDLNNFRGIVAGTVAEFDYLMSSIVEGHHSLLGDADKEKHINKIKKRMVASAKSNLKQCESLFFDKNVDLETIIKHRSFSSDLKCRTTKRVIEERDHLKDEAEVFEDMGKVLSLRNHLSHVRAVTDHKGTRLETDDQVFTDDEFTTVRVDLQKHHDNLTLVLDDISSSGEEEER